MKNALPTGSASSAAAFGMLWSAACVCALAIVALLTSSASAVAAGCPNESIRQSQSSNLNPATGQPYDAGLPDCRAYEKVTPDYKQSASVDLSSLDFPIAPDGSAVSWAMAGQVDGDGSSLGQGFYITRRGTEGWSTTNATAPFSLVPGLTVGKLPIFDHDLSRVVWCGWVDESAGLAAEQVDPIRCAVQSDGAWAATPIFRSVEAYRSNTGENAKVVLSGASSDLSHFVFSTGIRLSASDTASADVKTLYEVVTPPLSDPVLRVVNVDSAGTLIGPGVEPLIGGSTSTYQAVSNDGATIYFTTTPTGGVPTIFARRNGTTTIAVSNPSPAECTTCDPTAKPATYVGASVDGQRVFFTTAQQLLNADTDTTTDLYEYDFEAAAGHHLVQVSGGGAGDLTPGVGAQVSGVTQLSQDGTHVYFIAKGVLTTIANGQGQVAAAGSANLYIFERDAAFPTGRTRFVATVPASEESLLAGTESPTQATPDGRYLLFGTAAPLIGSGAEADTDSAVDIYRYDSQTGELRRVSVGEASYPASGNGNTAGMNAVVLSGRNRINLFNLGPSVAESRPKKTAISDDGASIVFTTPEKLQADDVNGGTSASACETTSFFVASNNGCDVYLWRNGSVSLISNSPLPNSQGKSKVLEAGISASGNDIFFTSPDPLVPADVDSNTDVYDARVGGGFPYLPPLPQCTGNEDCHGPAPSSPAVEGSGSSTFSGAGNEASASPRKHRHKRKSVKRRNAKKQRGKKSSQRRHG